ncbi:hypothetical protein E2C01_068388 [Portunus trituberculatus]|uniref:Uncharacterized protein n=1 Tax=Portunus trituberculatus TaxID=210409 RepID=A0A5B7HVN2_PORTR|nr:hypothetical protein [Portunus trituberculatus]
MKPSLHKPKLHHPTTSRSLTLRNQPCNTPRACPFLPIPEEAIPTQTRRRRVNETRSMLMNRSLGKELFGSASGNTILRSLVLLESVWIPSYMKG